MHQVHWWHYIKNKITITVGRGYWQVEQKFCKHQIARPGWGREGGREGRQTLAFVWLLLGSFLLVSYLELAQHMEKQDYI